MTEKTIDTLISDIDFLFKEGHVFNETNLEDFLKNLKELLIDRFKKKEEEPPYLRMSMIGTPNRKVWYLFNKPYKREYVANLKFLYGDIIEQLLLLFAKEAGHEVADEQAEVGINGVKGHIDARIDKWVIDVKSASRFAFIKFYNGTLDQQDSFGYIPQISGYAHFYKTTNCGFWAFNKETGEQVLYKVPSTDTIDVPRRIEELKEVVSLPKPPSEKCYEPEAFGKSGNKVINKNCTYCPYHEECWSDANGGKGLRKFKYYNGIQYFVEVLDTPRVEEILPDGGQNS